MEKKSNIEDFKLKIDDFISELEKNPEKINDLTEEEATEIDKYLNPYGATIYGEDKYTCLSFTNLKEKYMQKLLTTALIGFTYQMCDEYEIEDDELIETIQKSDFEEEIEHPDKKNPTFMKIFEENTYKEIKIQYVKNKIQNNPDDYKDDIKNNLNEILAMDKISKFELTEEEEINLRTETNNKINEELKSKYYFNNEKYLAKKEELIKKQSANEQKIIKNFLNKFFKYDPKNHTTEVYNSNHNDPERVKPKNNKFLDNIPPNDTYGRFQYYYDVNYEQLREAVYYLYCEKPDIEVAINIFDTFNSIEECREYINKNKDKVITNILTLTNYKWNLLGSFKENRERITFYNENTQVLENILKQQEEDAKLGKKLLDERVRKRKVKNVKEYGKTDPAVAKYLKENPNDITNNAHKVDILDDKVIVTEEIEISESGAKVDDDGTPEDAIEIGVTSINLKDNKVSTTKIYTKAHAPEIPSEKKE